MANNLIQIKRSLNTAVPTSLANGELAFTANGSHLYIGSPNGSIIPIGGFFNYGVLTANQALVANATGYIDAVKADTVTVRSINANGVASPGAGYILAVDGGGNTYWLNQSSISINTAAQFSWTNTHTFGANVVFNADVNANSITVDGLLTVNSSQMVVQKDAYFNANVAFGSDALDSVSFVATVGSNFIPTTDSTYTLGNSSVLWSNLFVDAATIGGITANATTLAIGTGVGIQGNGSIGTSGQVLTSNGTTVYWSTPSDTLIDAVTAGNGLSGGGTQGSVTVSVLANNGIIANSTGVFVSAGNGLVANSTGVHVGAANGINVTADTVGVAAGPTLTVNATGVHVNSALSITDLSLSGNLTVSGTLTTINTTNLTVQDPLIKLANGNSSTDSLDIGFYGVYGATGAKYSGIFRDATDGIYKLFKGVTTEPTTTVDTADVGYSIATLNAYLSSGALTTNATAVAITANSTVAVSVAANTLSWSGLAQNGIIYGGASGAFTSLSAGAGGTVLMVSTSGVPEFATLDGGTF